MRSLSNGMRFVEDDCPVRHVFGHDCASSDDRRDTDGDSGQDGGVGADNGVASNDGGCPLAPVGGRELVVSKADVRADEHIVLDEHAFGNEGEGLNFDAVADDNPVRNPDVAMERAAGAAFNLSNVGQLAEPEHRSSADFRVFMYHWNPP